MKILRFPDPKLRARSFPVAAFDDDFRRLVAAMNEAMVAARGAGLAAIQVGVPVRVFIIGGQVAGTGVIPKVFADPEIIEISQEAETSDEGCLSFPGIFVPVRRGVRVKVRARGQYGQTFEVEAERFYARALQHEIDHLDGKLLVDQVGPVKKDIIRRKLRKQARQLQDA